jgi:glutaminyl-peptide cyclotransferase
LLILCVFDGVWVMVWMDGVLLRWPVREGGLNIRGQLIRSWPQNAALIAFIGLLAGVAVAHFWSQRGPGKGAPSGDSGAMALQAATQDVVPEKPTKPVQIGRWKLDDQDSFSPYNLKVFLERFTEEPHPMGSDAQRRLARDLRFLLQSFGWQARLQAFRMQGPNLESARFGGQAVVARPTVSLEGENVIGYLPGPDACVVMFGGHYDTKLFTEFRFVGANDGGSSTALLLEMARILPRLWKGSDDRHVGSWSRCGIAMVFFDGEESLLPGWYDGVEALGIRDHLYGSRALVESLGKTPRQFLGKALEWVMVLDMVGHRMQKLMMTRESDPKLAEALEKLAVEVDLRRSPFQIDDDHMPFVEAGIPVVHVIDWTNLGEWHKPTDTIDIIGFGHLARLGSVLLRFMDQPRLSHFAKGSP